MINTHYMFKEVSLCLSRRGNTVISIKKGISLFRPSVSKFAKIRKSLSHSKAVIKPKKNYEE